MNISKLSGVFVFDMDEVLVNIGPLFYRTIRMNWVKYGPYFKDLGPLTDKQILERKLSHFDQWLLKDEYKNLPEEEYNKLMKKIRYMFKVDFFDVDVYSRLKPTEFARKTLMKKTFINHIRVEKVYILTRCVGNKMPEYKRKFVKKWFNHQKIEMIVVPENSSKADVLRKKGVNWDLFIDDEIKNIADFAEKLNIDRKEFLIPRLGYNEMPPLLDALIREKNGIYNYYDV